MSWRLKRGTWCWGCLGVSVFSSQNDWGRKTYLMHDGRERRVLALEPLLDAVPACRSRLLALVVAVVSPYIFSRCIAKFYLP